MTTTPPQGTPQKRTTIVRELLGGKVRLYRQNQNPMLYARAYLQGRYKVVRTGHTDEPAATKVAEQWFYGLQHRIQSGEHLHEPLFAELVTQFLTDPVVKSGVSDGQHDNYTKKWNVLAPYFPNVRVSQVTLDWLEQLRIKRSTVTNRQGVQITANTIDKDITFIRQVLATQIGYTPFICGEAGEKDRNEMPESFHICPAYGSDVVYIYRKEKSTGQEW